VKPDFERDGIPYFTCATCSFRFSRPARNANLENALDEYEDAYLQYLRPDPADDVNFEALRSWIERARPLADAAVLDVGCGSGKLVRHMCAHGARAVGLEPSAALHGHFLAGEPGFYLGTVGEFGRMPPQRFDVVTAFDVLEHVADPAEFLRELARLVAPGGHLFVSTPDVGSLAARVFGRRWHYYDRYHLGYFSRRTLEGAAGEAGFEPIAFTHLGRRKSAGYLLRYFFDFVLNRRPPAFVAALNRLYVPINLFDNMYLAFRRRPYGVNP
jgi:SAM-dependent methyltransferase